MAYRIVVCAKQVPDTKNITGEAMKADGTINRAALPAVFNPEDRNALEMGLSLRDIAKRCHSHRTPQRLPPQVERSGLGRQR